MALLRPENNAKQWGTPWDPGSSCYPWLPSNPGFILLFDREVFLHLLRLILSIPLGEDVSLADLTAMGDHLARKPQCGDHYVKWLTWRMKNERFEPHPGCLKKLKCKHPTVQNQERSSIEMFYTRHLKNDKLWCDMHRHQAGTWTSLNLDFIFPQGAINKTSAVSLITLIRQKLFCYVRTSVLFVDLATVWNSIVVPISIPLYQILSDDNMQLFASKSVVNAQNSSTLPWCHQEEGSILRPA